MASDAVSLSTTINSVLCKTAASVLNTTNITEPFLQSNSSNGTLRSTCNPYTTMPKQIANDYSKSIVRIFYVVVLLVGTIGNVLTCYIIITRKFMRRVIHIYTFNLAIADLIVIFLYVPVEMVRNEHDLKWNMGGAMCSLSYFITPTSLEASALTLVAITLDRHRGVTKPFLWRGDSSKILKWTIPAIWIIALVSSAPLTFVAKVERHPNGLYCVEAFPSKIFMKVYWITMFILQVVLPLGIIVIANTHMICTMTKLSRQTEQAEQRKQHIKMIRMVVLLVLVYAICTSPQHIIFFWFVFGDLEKQASLSKNIFKVANLLVIVQSAINPIIYGTGRKDFSRAFKSIFQCAKLRELLSRFDNDTETFEFEATKARTQGTSGIDEPSLVHKISPVRNLRLEKLKEKHSRYNVTDTPPLIRKDDDKSRRVSEPIRNPGEGNTNKMIRPKKRYASLPNGRVGSLRLWRGLKAQYEIQDEQKRNSFNFSWHFGSNEIECLLDSPETVV